MCSPPGRDVVITPDGPRGPAYELGPGIIFLAQKTGAPVMPMNMEYSSCWRVKSWDRFIIPRPFSKVRVIVGEPAADKIDIYAGRIRSRAMCACKTR